MIKNGYIAFVTESGVGQDSAGNPVAPTQVTSDYISSNLKTITREYKIQVDGEYIKASYSVYVEQRIFAKLGVNLEQVRMVYLKDANGNVLSNYRIINHEYLNISKQIKIVV